MKEVSKFNLIVGGKEEILEPTEIPKFESPGFYIGFSISGCAACGEPHDDLKQEKFDNPSGEGEDVDGFFCPKTGIEVYMRPA